MAMNPMQRKANNYLIIGVLVTLLITGTVIALLCMQLIKMQQERQAEQASRVDVYVASTQIKSGENIDVTLLTSMSVPSGIIPSSAIDITQIASDTVAKIDITPGTVITAEMIASNGEKTTDDLRKQEYNMILLPSQIQTGNYIDIRLRLPNGVDYIVASKKRVELPIVDGVDSENTIWLKMSEAEIQVMSNAIVEAYIMQGSLLYATTYIEPGLQEVSTPTYVPSGKVQEAIYANPNIENDAKAALISRYNSNSSIRTNTITEALNPYASSAQATVETKTQEEITKVQQERQKYLESLSAVETYIEEEEE